MLAAIARGDAVSLAALMADDFELTSVGGKYYGMSKREMIARWTAPPAVGTTSTSTLITVARTFGSGGVGFVAGEIEDRTTSAGNAECAVHAFTDIWVRRGARWVWLQSHESGDHPAPCRP